MICPECERCAMVEDDHVLVCPLCEFELRPEDEEDDE